MFDNYRHHQNGIDTYIVWYEQISCIELMSATIDAAKNMRIHSHTYAHK